MSDDLEDIRRRKAEELQRQGINSQNEQRQQEQAQAIEQQKQTILRSILSDPAKQRLNNIKLVKPQLADAVENQLISLSQSGRIRDRISEEQLLQMLQQLQTSKRETQIKFKRV